MRREPKLSPYQKMSVMKIVRDAVLTDLPAMMSIVDSTDLFPSSMLRDMMASYFNGNPSSEIWIIVESEGHQLGLAYCAPERMTDGTWNLLLIAVHDHVQGNGYGQALVSRIEDRLNELGGRVLLVETSGLPEYDKTRSFYLRCGYAEEARIRDFYKAGEDKIVFWKQLGPRLGDRRDAYLNQTGWKLRDR